MSDGTGVMNEELDSQLSAMFDGQLPGAECELLSRRLGRDDALRTRWASYAVTGAVIRSEPIGVVRSNFARRVSAAIVADERPAARRVAGGRRLALQFGISGALVASVAAVSVLLLRQQGAPLADEVVIAQSAPTAAASAAGTAAAPVASQSMPASREPASYVVPPVSGDGRLAPPAQLASYVVAHSEYSSPLVRRSLLSALVSSDAADSGGKAGTSDASDGSTAP